MNKRRLTKSSTNAKGRSTKFRLGARIRDSLTPTKITFTLSKQLTEELCEDIQRTLKIKEDIVTTEYTPLGKFYMHTVWVRANNRHKIKDLMTKLRKKHPGIAIAYESVSYKKQIWPWAASVGSVLLTIWKVFDLLQ